MPRSDGYRLFIDLGLKVAELPLNIVKPSNLLGEGPLESCSLRIQLYERECQRARTVKDIQRNAWGGSTSSRLRFKGSPRLQDLELCSLLPKSSTMKRQYVHLGTEPRPLPLEH